MSNDIKIKKGLNINLKGEAKKTVEQAIYSNFHVIRPEDFHSVLPRLVAKEGAIVKAGETVFHDKTNESIKYVSPVSGKIVQIERGPKRRIDAIKIQADKKQTYVTHSKINLDNNIYALVHIGWGDTDNPWSNYHLLDNLRNSKLLFSLAKKLNIKTSQITTPFI